VLLLGVLVSHGHGAPPCWLAQPFLLQFGALRSVLTRPPSPLAAPRPVWNPTRGEAAPSPSPSAAQVLRHHPLHRVHDGLRLRLHLHAGGQSCVVWPERFALLHRARKNRALEMPAESMQGGAWRAGNQAALRTASLTPQLPTSMLTVSPTPLMPRTVARSVSGMR